MWGGAVRKLCAVPQTRKQSICVRHEDLIENTKSWLVEFQEQFRLKTKPNFPIEVLTSLVTTDLIKCISQLHLTCPSSAATFAIKVLSGRANYRCCQASDRAFLSLHLLGMATDAAGLM